MDEIEIKKNVREGYAAVARQGASCCGSAKSSCCGPSTSASKSIGYTDEDVTSVPDGADLGLGCGNPVALASLKEGEAVLDLGSGAGFDCFLAAKRVGQTGRVIGVDMTPEMIDRARENARNGKYTNVEFRLGEIENLPVADNTVDIIISNCVINLSTDKSRVFREAFRALKPGGRLMVSDIVRLKDLPAFIRESVDAYVGCISGAMLKDAYLDAIKAAGFGDVKVVEEATFPIDYISNDPAALAIVEQTKAPMEEVMEFGRSVLSVRVEGRK
ncbi:MAG: arsenite S-adenosylmethyltransferase [Chloroflexi bacterium RBG_16_57_8]|nr:MAG: arsenite S-adenosylmethyltransferase [Chloroflexi bacterium RBG_16_57_8]